MDESVIIQKLIQVGQMLERGELEYIGAEFDTKHYLEQYAALSQPSVSGRSEQFVCGANRVMGEKRCEKQCGQCEELYPQTNSR